MGPPGKGQIPLPHLLRFCWVTSIPCPIPRGTQIQVSGQPTPCSWVLHCQEWSAWSVHKGNLFSFSFKWFIFANIREQFPERQYDLWWQRDKVIQSPAHQTFRKTLKWRMLVSTKPLSFKGDNDYLQQSRSLLNLARLGNWKQGCLMQGDPLVFSDIIICGLLSLPQILIQFIKSWQWPRASEFKFILDPFSLSKGKKRMNKGR